LFTTQGTPGKQHTQGKAIRSTVLAGAAFAATALLGAAPAHAADAGTASATTAKVGLDVKLLGSAVEVPVTASLNELRAPAGSDTALLTATVSGVQGGPATLLQATVDKTQAVVDAHGSRASVHLVDAAVHVPGLPLLGLVTVHELTSRSDCPVDGVPSASAQVLGTVSVLGERVSLGADGETRVDVPVVGAVTLALSQHSTRSDQAAATALDLKVSVNPLKLNVADVTGDIVLGATSCQKAAADPAGDPGATAAPSSGSGTGSGGGASTADPQRAAATPMTKLAETGSSSATPVIAGVAVVLVVGGAGAVHLVRRRRA
jgi:LPXTG-motif cell wall-anchored protein